MATPSLASVLSGVSTASKAIASAVTLSEKDKSVLNRIAHEFKWSPSSESLKQEEPVLHRSQKPLQKNPFTTYRDPATGQWMVERNKC